VCGRCDDVCPPVLAGEAFAPRAFLQGVKANVPFEESVKTGWHCATCAACRDACPVGIVPFDQVQRARMLAIERSVVLPPRLGDTLEMLYKYQNPTVAAKGRKGAWSRGLPAADVSAGTAPRVLYFAGCTTSLDPRLHKVGRAVVSTLRRAGMDVATLGKHEPCCGDIARRLGEDGLFNEQAQETMACLGACGAATLVTASPHCFHTMRNDYQRPAADGGGSSASVSIYHHTEFLARLLDEGRLVFPRPHPRRVTYHDPCYLARHNGVVAPPRRLLSAVPGLTLVEMLRHGTSSLCCGGGGGRMLQEFESDTPVTILRLREAVATGAEVLVTACPECLTMFEAARKTASLESAVQIMDINELLWEAIQP
jgi:Fe-S oxidoreductase